MHAYDFNGCRSKFRDFLTMMNVSVSGEVSVYESLIKITVEYLDRKHLQ